jgi:hypothetical protein
MLHEGQSRQRWSNARIVDRQGCMFAQDRAADGSPHQQWKSLTISGILLSGDAVSLPETCNR